jgi:integrase
MTTQYISVPGQGRIYRRGKVWYLDYWVDGARVREKASGNQRDAMKLLGDRTSAASQTNGAPLKKKVVPFSTFADEYLEFKANGPKPKRSIRSIRGYVSHLKDFFGEVPLSRITPERVEEYQRTRAEEAIVTSKKAAEEGEEEQPTRKMKGASINREVATLRNLFNIARKKKLFRGDNPASGLAFFPEQKRRHYVLTLEEYSKLISAAEPNLRPIIQVAVQTGLRKDDILGLKRKDIDFKRRVLTAWVSKTQEWQTFRMGEGLAAMFKAIPGSGEYIFANPKTGTRWSDVKKWWEAAKKKAGLDAPGLLRFHDLRANAGIRVEEKAGAYAAQMLLGHKNPKTTQIYLDLTPERAQAAAKALAEFFKVTPPTSGTNVAQRPERKNTNVAVSTH